MAKNQNRSSFYAWGFQYPLHELEEEMRVVESLGIKAVILFGIPAEKDAVGTQAYHDHGIIQEATRLIKKFS